jgi:AraC-like DNA-binding protein
MARKTVEIFENMDFGIVHDIDQQPNVNDFTLHNHDDLYEIVLLVEGDCEFHVEGNTYRLKPNDIVFTRPFEMHKMSFVSKCTYDRIIVYIKQDYLKNHNCEKFLNIFQNRQIGTGNCISNDIANIELRNCIYRLNQYGAEKAYDVAEHTVFEFLYLMNGSKNSLENFYVKDKRVRDIIMYINSNLSNDLNLDVIADRFFISKHYLCNIFKKFTGHTVIQYINYKRIMMVQEFCRNGQSLIQASLNAGFNSYANFYKAYVKQFNTPPRSMK